MRKIGWFLFSASAILVSVALVEGQQEEKKKGNFGGFGGFGAIGLRQSDPLVLLRNGAVKKELDISDEQMEKIPGEVMVAISKVLDEKQMKRFRQIELQQRGNNAFKDSTVQKELKLNDEQAKSVLSILDDTNKELAEMRKGGGGGAGTDFKARAEKLDSLNKDTKEKIYNVLSKDQRKAWRDMLGEELKLEANFGGGAGGFGRKNKKKTDSN